MARKTMVHAAAKKQNGTQYSEFPLFEYGGGLNNKNAPAMIAENQASDLLNVNFDQYPAIQSRNGYATFGTQIDGNPIMTLITYNKIDGTRLFLATSGTSIYQWNGTAWASIKTGLTGNGLRFTYQVYLNNLYLTNGVDGLIKYDGTTVSVVSGAPQGKYLTLFKNHLFMAGDPANPNLLYFSDLASAESWPSLDVIAENTNDGDVITGLKVFKDMLIVMKERGKFIVRGSGPSNYVNSGPNGKGTVSHFSMVVIPANENGGRSDLLIFLSRDGVYGFDGVNDHLLSDHIQGSVNQWNQQFLSGSVAIDYGHKYWLSVPEGSVSNNTVTYILDYVHMAWSKYSIAASCFVIYQDPTKLTPNLYNGDPTVGQVYQQDTGNLDNGQPFDAYYVTKQFDFGAPQRLKRFKQLFLFAPTELQDYSISVTYNEDFGRYVQSISLPLQSSNVSKWGTMNWGDQWGGNQNITTKTTSIPGTGRYMSFKIENKSTNFPWAFYGLVTRYKVTERMA